jgi:hypothetical protein
VYALLVDEAYVIALLYVLNLYVYALLVDESDLIAML